MICKELLENLQKFFGLLEDISAKNRAWLTVEDVADELKISKSIVYRLIRAGKIKAINISENNGKFNSKGCYRIQRAAIQEYIDKSAVYTEPVIENRHRRRVKLPEVKNYLGL